ncbi:hypothetical protein AMAG_14446 [Allomyces macrogynus ATCC 38327]|uniref:Uncharacterized protein n=1 Tax=Allomyces macrogynus (strain ATCC 38327) TaxID=578462 RepID=A0A0L0T675_ALLM3|nr:hypothetical protein AMAG_14446 [Allomyces macrogynus ATCC 38327]|eukprot:KNE70298.1 hypothetical protein AMAG_14446 [Allomyces macrogynus ATCC 38327]
MFAPRPYAPVFREEGDAQAAASCTAPPSRISTLLESCGHVQPSLNPTGIEFDDQGRSTTAGATAKLPPRRASRPNVTAFSTPTATSTTTTTTPSLAASAAAPLGWWTFRSTSLPAQSTPVPTPASQVAATAHIGIQIDDDTSAAAAAAAAEPATASKRLFGGWDWPTLPNPLAKPKTDLPRFETRPVPPAPLPPAPKSTSLLDDDLADDERRFPWLRSAPAPYSAVDRDDFGAVKYGSGLPPPMVPTVSAAGAARPAVAQQTMTMAW